jgi:putative ABC transport system substrate-binding protein
VICDESITAVTDLKGKSIAAEAGVVDHFLLLQGLAEEGMTEDDIEFSGLATDAAAAAFALEAIGAPVRDTSELESVVAAQARAPNGGLLVMPDTFTTTHRVEIISLAARYRLPAVYPYRFFAELGGLLSYGNDPVDNFRRAATYVDRILKGAKPSELPVQTPVKFELVINLKTAKALGLNVPSHLRQRVDAVIE